jgi:hypothetical protein
MRLFHDNSEVLIAIPGWRAERLGQGSFGSESAPRKRTSDLRVTVTGSLHRPVISPSLARLWRVPGLTRECPAAALQIEPAPQLRHIEHRKKGNSMKFGSSDGAGGIHKGGRNRGSRNRLFAQVFEDVAFRFKCSMRAVQSYQ